MGFTDGEKEISKGKRLVTDLVEPYFGSRRGVSVDCLFTSVALAEELQQVRDPTGISSAL
jgi:hypothetical protein